MKTIFRQAAMVLLWFSLITGIAYPLVTTALAQTFFPDRSRGSIVRLDNRAVGSELIGQSFTDPKYFWGRPSMTPGHPYNARESNASNLGPTNPALRELVAERIRVLREVDPDNRDAVPVDLVTASASGLDPHISPAAAYFQASRIARLRGLDVSRVRALVDGHVEKPAFGFLGEPRVHVLHLNLALDAITKSGPT